MKMFTVFVIGVVSTLACGATAVLAQSDPIKTREHLMKGNNDHARIVVEMVKGQRAFDAKAVAAAFDQWAHTAKKLPELFPPDSETGEKTRASPKIWENKKDFDEKAAAFGEAVGDHRAEAVGSLDGLKVAVSAVGRACNNCHDDYRLKEN
jgi:cytochrome c556